MEPLTIIKSISFANHPQSRFPLSLGSRSHNDPFAQNNNLHIKLHKRFRKTIIRSFARRSAAKKLKRNGESRRNQPTSGNSSDEYNALVNTSSRDDYDNGVLSKDIPATKNLIATASRSDVLQACTVTSGLLFALALVIREVSHIAYSGGWPVHDCSTESLFEFEMWHLELIIGLVILISSCRYILLQTWPDFAQSSEVSNQQVLNSLQPLDYVVVAFLPGISEELLFRGALLPLFGFNLKSALVVAAIFGVLHLGGGRRFSFAIWATFVGLAYGYATIASSSIFVPITSHALNNLVGGVLWYYTSNTSEKK